MPDAKRLPSPLPFSLEQWVLTAAKAAADLFPRGILDDSDSRTPATGPNPVIPPVSPPGVSLDSDIEEALSHRGVKPVNLASLLWFYNRVKPRGAWDYKRQDQTPDHPRSQLYEPYGNFLYGATGRALGFPPDLLLSEAGRAQPRNGQNTGVPGARWPSFFGLPVGGTPPYGDTREDQEWIRQGMQYFDEYGKRRK